MKRKPTIEASLEAVMQADRITLTAHWMHLYGSAPPNKTRTEFLRQAIGWQVQAQIHGGLDATCRKLLQRISTAILPAGTRLIREWWGVSHQVTVLGAESGFEYQGRVYASLSAIARVITGTSWNGLVFFGVKK